MPIGKYKNFKSCQRAVARKGVKNTGAYCGAIEATIKGTRKKVKKYRDIEEDSMSWAKRMDPNTGSWAKEMADQVI